MQGSQGPNDMHETVGAYALGILDDAEATAFEAHLATCEWCARQLDELAGMEPMLAALADMQTSQGSQGSPAVAESLSAKPSPRLAERLVDEVAERRARKRRRGMYLVAAAAALIIGGPLTVVAASGGETEDVARPGPAASSASLLADMGEKVSATDPTTKVSATVGMTGKAWGTDALLELRNVTGPEKCSLVAVGKNGERETVSSWSVPKWGYGIPGSTHEKARDPLYVQGGAAFDRDDIDRFEVVTFDGDVLVEVDA
ncbi:anti-sigma factor family protein [Streptomyces minutiscleroticus]|uniref:RNA polymerase subunit sigma n=1 Tax=Streptomyces minutiscleroticus TaxID=68238 RepID=A0A918NF19_9ACTN|nr:zf-HC2 domain-containing protein [Streptomyces minutiscleroticus]GGX65665.1 RNA polymerase subunit sigma [Streptomyces minutiscleroticus]